MREKLRKICRPYLLNEIVYMASLFDANFSDEEVADLIGRSPLSVKRRISRPVYSEAGSSPRSILQYSLSELYEHFGEQYPESDLELEKDIKRRIDCFKQFLLEEGKS